jgi:hypothetical protein
MTEVNQPDECTSSVHWEVSWKSKISPDVHTVVRRDMVRAYDMAIAQRDAGFETKLHRVEKTEMAF